MFFTNTRKKLKNVYGGMKAKYDLSRLDDESAIQALQDKLKDIETPPKCCN